MTTPVKAIGVLVALILFSAAPMVRAAEKSPVVTLNQKDDGFRGIWYFVGKIPNSPYVYKYSGGCATYCAKHNPCSIYSKEADKTFFCYGGTTKDSNRHLMHMVSYFDHKTKKVARPTILLDKQTGDAHDNPVISIDDDGYIWIFSTAHGLSRDSFIHKSKKPYDIEEFERVEATIEMDGETKPLTNFSYVQVRHHPTEGFLFFFTKYRSPANRTSFFMKSADGKAFGPAVRLAAIEAGHYQTSTLGKDRIGTAFNFHPKKKGVNYRSNLYYMQSDDFGSTWTTAGGKPLKLPITKRKSEALVVDTYSKDERVYLKDICFDEDNQPVIMFLTSQSGNESGPETGVRKWWTARWTEGDWAIHPITTSDQNYDMGSLYLEPDGTWRVIAPTAPGPQPHNTGGDIVMWESRDKGKNWKEVKQLTHSKLYNHSYARRPINAHPDFYAIWSDGHGRKPSISRLYFCNQKGDVWQLPAQIEEGVQMVDPIPYDGE